MSARNTRSDIRRKQRLRETAYRRAIEQAFKAEQQQKAQSPASDADKK